MVIYLVVFMVFAVFSMTVSAHVLVHRVAAEVEIFLFALGCPIVMIAAVRAISTKAPRLCRASSWHPLISEDVHAHGVCAPRGFCLVLMLLIAPILWC